MSNAKCQKLSGDKNIVQTMHIFDGQCPPLLGVGGFSWVIGGGGVSQCRQKNVGLAASDRATGMPPLSLNNSQSAVRPMHTSSLCKYFEPLEEHCCRHCDNAKLIAQQSAVNVALSLHSNVDTDRNRYISQWRKVHWKVWPPISCHSDLILVSFTFHIGKLGPPPVII